MEKTGFDMYVFRDGRKEFGGGELRDRVATALRGLRSNDSRDAELRALIAAGEFECALRDAADSDEQWRRSAEVAEEITSGAAKMLLRGELSGLTNLEDALFRIDVPEQLSVAVLEGFAYYALHPQKFIDLLAKLKFERRAAVVGIRSIGAPLSAVVAEAVGAAERITVRPTGHPYDRSLEPDSRFRQFVDRNRDCEFLIVDEGPGLSGSSFLAVAEALERMGIAAGRITMLGSRRPDAAQLKTGRALERWPRFRFVATQEEPVLPKGAEEGIGGGYWRRIFLTDFENQPASWTQLEMSKYLSRDRREFYKFEGFGHFGDEIGERSKTLERFGVGPKYLGNEDGFGKYEVVQGALLSASDLKTDVLRMLARYCAMRGREFVARKREESKLPEMLAWNWKCEFGEELPRQVLEVRRLVVADARMQPHEWISAGGRLMKLDGVSHGDDHFFPGPCDVAWDVAGAIVEWDMVRQAREYFVSEYVRESGDDVSDRLGAYLMAYATFRMGWSKMAAHASSGEFDEGLLHRDYLRYRAVCQRLRKIAVAA